MKHNRKIVLEIGFHAEHKDKARNDEILERLLSDEKKWRKDARKGARSRSLHRIPIRVVAPHLRVVGRPDRRRRQPLKPPSGLRPTSAPSSRYAATTHPPRRRDRDPQEFERTSDRPRAHPFAHRLLRRAGRRHSSAPIRSDSPVTPSSSRPLAPNRDCRRPALGMGRDRRREMRTRRRRLRIPRRIDGRSRRREGRERFRRRSSR